MQRLVFRVDSPIVEKDNRNSVIEELVIVWNKLAMNI